MWRRYIGVPLLLIVVLRLFTVLPELVDKRPLATSTTTRVSLGERVSTFERLPGAETFYEDQSGNVYTGLADGTIVRLRADTGHIEHVARLGNPQEEGCGSFESMSRCGRPLGMAISPLNAEELIVCDGMNRGLMSVNLSTGTKTTLISKVDGVAIRFCNALVITPNGIVLFTQSDSQFMIPDFLKSVLAVRPSGRLIEYNLQSGQARVLLDSLHFANGILLTPSGAELYVVDMARGKLVRSSPPDHQRTIEEALLEVPPPNPSPLRQSLALETDVVMDNLSINPFNGNILFGTSASIKPYKIIRMLGLGQVFSLIPLRIMMKIAPINKADSFVVEVNPSNGHVDAIYEDPKEGLSLISEGFLAYKNPDSIFFGRMLIGTFDPHTSAKLHRFPRAGEVTIPHLSTIVRDRVQPPVAEDAAVETVVEV